MKFVTIIFIFCSLSYGKSPKKHGSSNDGSFIIGGHNVSIKQYPYMVNMLLAIMEDQFNGFSGACGGTILHTRYILTAGHCLAVRPFNISINLGSTEYDQGKHYYTNLYKIHSKFNYTTADYDVGVVITKIDMELDGINAKPVVLATEDTVSVPGNKVTLVGWGTHSNRSTDAPGGTLRAVTVAIVGAKECQKLYSRPDYSQVSPRMICVGDLVKGGKGTCEGDSGGPAVDINGVQVGIVSWALGCAQADHPDVLTNVASVRSWVRQVAGV